MFNDSASKLQNNKIKVFLLSKFAWKSCKRFYVKTNEFRGS